MAAEAKQSDGSDAANGLTEDQQVGVDKRLRQPGALDKDDPKELRNVIVKLLAELDRRSRAIKDCGEEIEELRRAQKAGDWELKRMRGALDTYVEQERREKAWLKRELGLDSRFQRHDELSIAHGSFEALLRQTPREELVNGLRGLLRRHQSLRRSHDEVSDHAKTVLTLAKDHAELQETHRQLQKAHMAQTVVVQRLQSSQSKIQEYKETVTMQEEIIARLEDASEERRKPRETEPDVHTAEAAEEAVAASSSREMKTQDEAAEDNEKDGSLVDEPLRARLEAAEAALQEKDRAIEEAQEAVQRLSETCAARDERISFLEEKLRLLEKELKDEAYARLRESLASMQQTRAEDAQRMKELRDDLDRKQRAIEELREHVRARDGILAEHTRALQGVSDGTAQGGKGPRGFQGSDKGKGLQETKSSKSGLEAQMAQQAGEVGPPTQAMKEPASPEERKAPQRHPNTT